MQKYIEKIKSFLKSQQFNPGILGFFLNPFYFVRRAIYLNIQWISEHIKWDILDVWCWAQPYKEIFKNRKKYIGIDLEQSWHDHSLEKEDKIFYDGKKIPFDDEYFDTVVSFEVLEHVFNPDEFLIEIKRVMKKWWQLLLTVPFVWDEHEVPYDFWRYSSFWLKSILEKHWFIVILQRKILTDISFFFQLLNTYFYKIIIKRMPKILAFPLIMFLSIISNIFWLISKILPKNEDFYYWNLILAQKK